MTLSTVVAPKWIVCRGSVRHSIEGRVQCPLRELAIALSECATCRSLEDAEDDRFAAWTCRADAADRRGRDEASFLIELL
jgi:hypothetical protein